MTTFAVTAPNSRLIINMDSRLNVNNLPAPVNCPPNPYQPDSIPNRLNSKSGGFLVSSILGGFEGRNMGRIVFSDSQEIKTEISARNMGLLQQTGINMGVGAAVYGTLSILKQGSGLISGRQDARGAMANITADLLRGGGAGLGATAGGGLTGIAMKAMGATGTFGTVMTVIGGVLGANLGAGLVESTGVREKLLKGFGSEKMMVPGYGSPSV